MISTIILGSIGIGLSIWYFLNLNVINEVPKEFKSDTKEEIYPMTEDILIHYYNNGNLDFIEDNSMQDKVRIRIDYYPIANDVDLVEENNEIYLDFNIVENINIKEITDSVINNLKKGKFHAYDKLGQVSMTITTSKENIEKIKGNYQHYQDEIDYEDF